MKSKPKMYFKSKLIISDIDGLQNQYNSGIDSNINRNDNN